MEASIGVFAGSACGGNREVTDGRGTMSESYEPKPEDRFSFGLWTVGNTARDPFGEPVHDPLSPSEIASPELAL